MSTPAPVTTAGLAPMTITGPAPVTKVGPAPAVCTVCPKGKEYKNKQGLSAHIKRAHQNAIDQVQKLASMLSPTSSIDSLAPTASAPTAASTSAAPTASPAPTPVQQTLSFSGSQQSLNNDDIVAATNTNEEAETELQQEEEFMREAKEELEVHEALMDLAEEAFDQESEEKKARSNERKTPRI